MSAIIRNTLRTSVRARSTIALGQVRTYAGKTEDESLIKKAGQALKVSWRLSDNESGVSPIELLGRDLCTIAVLMGFA
jgi:hypothetical protein